MPFDILVKQNATVDDTLRLIVNAVNVCSKSPFVLRVAESIAPGADKPTFIRALFDYICRNGKYELDTPGTEEVWTPEKTIREGKFDCKKVTVFLASVLKAAGIEPVLKHVYYAGTDGSLQEYTHIYVVVPASSLQTGTHTMEFKMDPYITLDPTNNCMFNTEVDSSKQTLYFLDGKKMELRMMGKAPGAYRYQGTVPGQTRTGMAPNMDGFMPTINQAACKLTADMDAICGPYTVAGSNQYFTYTTAEKIAHAAKVVAYAAPRAAFLGLLYLGKLLANTPLKLNLASHIAYAWNANPNKFRKLWWLQGGEADASAIQTALKKIVGGVIYGPPQPSTDRPWIITDVNYGHPGMNGTSIGQGPETLAALATATPIIAVVLKFLQDNNFIKPGQADPPAAPGTVPVTPPSGVPAPKEPIPPPPSDASFATHSIDNFVDLLNFIKASAVIQLGASLHPALIVPTTMMIGISFLYAIRNKIFA